MVLTLLCAVAAGMAVFLVRPARPALSDRLVRSERLDRSDRVPVPPPEGGGVPGAVVADLVAAVLAAGLPAEAALEAVHRHAGSIESHGLESVRQALDLAVATGLAPGEMVRAAATEQRRDRAAAQIRAARRLGVLVVLPVGLCLLPAFVAVTVVPLVLALLSRTLG